MKKLKKLLSVLSVVLCVLIVCACFSFAASSSVNIYSNESVKYTGTIAANKVKFSGHNNSSSSRALYIKTQVQNEKGKWIDSDELLLQPGTNFNEINDPNYYTVSTNWRLELNPYGVATTGCTGSGTITSR